MMNHDEHESTTSSIAFFVPPPPPRFVTAVITRNVCLGSGQRKITRDDGVQAACICGLERSMGRLVLL